MILLLMVMGLEMNSRKNQQDQVLHHCRCTVITWCLPLRPYRLHLIMYVMVRGRHITSNAQSAGFSLLSKVHMHLYVCILYAHGRQHGTVLVPSKIWRTESGDRSVCGSEMIVNLGSVIGLAGSAMKLTLL